MRYQNQQYVIKSESYHTKYSAFTWSVNTGLIEIKIKLESRGQSSTLNKNKIGSVNYTNTITVA